MGDASLPGQNILERPARDTSGGARTFQGRHRATLSISISTLLNCRMLIRSKSISTLEELELPKSTSGSAANAAPSHRFDEQHRVRPLRGSREREPLWQ